MAFGIAEGVLQRDEVVAYIRGLFPTEAYDSADPDFLSMLAIQLFRLHPADSMETIRNAYSHDLIVPFYIGLGEFEAECQKPREEVLAAYLESQRKELAETPHEHMSWWACFQSKKELRANADRIEALAAARRESRRQKRNAKRKQEKANKKKNRKAGKKKRKK
jgi:hypothetical protein